MFALGMGLLVGGFVAINVAKIAGTYLILSHI